MNILITIACNLGDNVCSDPAIRAIRVKYPNAEITISTRYMTVWDGYKYADCVIPFRRISDTKGCDLKFHFDGSVHGHIVDCLAGEAVFDLTDRIPRLAVTESEVLAAREKFKTINFDLPTVIISGEASHVGREWSRRQWELLCERLGPHIQTVQIGRQRPFLRNVQHRLINKTTLREMMAVVSLSKLCICVDSGVSHIAAALGIPAVVIYGPVPAAIRSHTGLTFPVETDFRSMAKIKADMVYAAAQAVLKEKYGLEI